MNGVSKANYSLFALTCQGSRQRLHKPSTECYGSHSSLYSKILVVIGTCILCLWDIQLTFDSYIMGHFESYHIEGHKSVGTCNLEIS